MTDRKYMQLPAGMRGGKKAGIEMSRENNGAVLDVETALFCFMIF